MRLIRFSYLNCKFTWKIGGDECSETIRLIGNFHKLFFSFFSRIILLSAYSISTKNIFQHARNINYLFCTDRSEFSFNSLFLNLLKKKT